MHRHIIFSKDAAEDLDSWSGLSIISDGWEVYKKESYKYKVMEGVGALDDLMFQVGFVYVTTRRPRKGEFYVVPTGEKGKFVVMLATQHNRDHVWPIVAPL